MRHPADHDPDRHYYVLFVEGKGYITNYSMWVSKKEYLQYDERVERASFWDCAEAVPTTPGAKTHCVRRNNKGIEDLDKNVTLAQETPAADPKIMSMIRTWWSEAVKLYPFPDNSVPRIIETPHSIAIDWPGMLSDKGASDLVYYLKERSPIGIVVTVTR